jgi:hypothetical protein
MKKGHPPSLIAEIQITETGYWKLDTGYWILDTGYWILDTGKIQFNS